MEVSGEFVKMFAKVVDTMCIYEHTVYVNKILKGKSILKLLQSQLRVFHRFSYALIIYKGTSEDNIY